MSYLIIGNSAAAIGAIEGIRSIDPDKDITVVSDEEHLAYSRPLISYYLGDKVQEEKMLYRDEDFYRQNKVKLKLGRKAVKIIPGEKQVELDDQSVVAYEKLLLATGGKAVVPPITGIEKKGIYTFLKFDEVKEIKEQLSGLKKVVVIGAGLIGLKAAEALRLKGLEVTVVEMADRVLPSILDREAASIVAAHLQDKGIKLRLDNVVAEFLGEDVVTGVRLANGDELEADLAIVAAGVKPNTDLFLDLDLPSPGGVEINEMCATSVSDIYAAGDVVKSKNLLTEKMENMPIWPNAYLQGECAGKNMAGAKIKIKPLIPMNAIGFFDLPMITAGVVTGNGEDDEELINCNEENKSYRKLVLRDDKIVGYIFLNVIDRAGIITDLLNQKILVKKFKQELLKENFGNLDLPETYYQHKMEKGGV